MAYSDNPQTLESMRPLLSALNSASSVTWQTPYGRARWFAYRVREALRLAKKLDDPLGRRTLRVEVIAPNAVRARDVNDAAPEVLGSITFRAEEPRFAEVPSAKVDTRSFSEVEDVISAWQSKSPLQGRLHLPKTWLDREQLLELLEWARVEEVIFFEHEGTLTLMPRVGNEDAALYAWSPEDDE